MADFTEGLNTRQRNRLKTNARWMPYIRHRFQYRTPLTSTEAKSWTAEGNTGAGKIAHVCDLFRAVSVTKLNDNIEAKKTSSEADKVSSSMYSFFSFNPGVRKLPEGKAQPQFSSRVVEYTPTTNQNCPISGTKSIIYNPLQPQKLLNQKQISEKPRLCERPLQDQVTLSHEDTPDKKNPVIRWWRFQAPKPPLSPPSLSLDTNLSTSNSEVTDVNSFSRSDNCVFTSVAGLLGMTVQQLLDTTEEMQTQDGLSLSQLIRFCKEAGVPIMYIVELASEKRLLQHLDYTLNVSEGVKTLIGFERSDGSKHMVVLKAWKTSKGVIRKSYEDFQKKISDPSRKTLTLSHHNPTLLFYFETGNRRRANGPTREMSNCLTTYFQRVSIPHVVHFL